MVHSTVLYLMYCAGPLAVKNLVDWPVCASSPRSLLGTELELDRMSGDSEPDSGRAYIVGVVDHPYLATRLPLWLTLSSYASTMPVVLVVRDASTADPTKQELGNCDVGRADPTEQELGNWDVARVDSSERELKNCDVGRADPTEQELGNWDVARVDPSERELENCDVGRADPTEQELGNWDGARVYSTEQELGNCDSDFRQGRTWAQTLGFGQGGELGHKSGDLAERVSSGANMEIWPSK
ncbi:hypothetical protein B296_00042483 [Ensete ventricosum]|uniref:Uncharacterized protein n=1 Tax=Ensete ventricosum TaxID=4639 RepID=A0A426Z2U5_ENSVE|nr:hypothetical protein B296_00042483 [Ensete ventricosum]